MLWTTKRPTASLARRVKTWFSKPSRVPRYRKTLLVEALEPRLLLSADPLTSLASMASALATDRITGVTVITHGFQVSDSSGDALLGLGRAIVNFEQNADNDANDTAWLLDYDVRDGGSSAGFDMQTSSANLPSATDAANLPRGELVLVFDWACESNALSAGWTEAAGDALFGLLADLHLVDPDHPSASKPLHFIAHSFGSAVTSEAVERLAYYGVKVDQVTLLDPHDFDQSWLPVDGSQAQSVLGTPAGYGATKWDNVSFMDVYFETRGINSRSIPDFFVPIGRPIPGAYNVLLDAELPPTNAYDPANALNPLDFGDASGDHSYVWADFYAGTIPGAYDYVNGRYREKIDVNNNNTLGDEMAGGMDGKGLRLGEGVGYAFSRLRHSATRPASDFYDLAADPMAGHDYTPAALKPLPGTGAGRPEPQGGDAPQWSPFRGDGAITNGDFEFTSGEDIPGWSYHLGGGSGDATMVGSSAVRLDKANSSRTHNVFYVPGNATHLSFDVRDVVQSSLDLGASKLRVSVLAPGKTSSTVLADLSLALLAGQARHVVLPLLSSDTVDRSEVLRFELVGVEGSSQLTLDNVQLQALASGRSNDVIWVSLPELLGGAGVAVPSSFDITKLTAKSALSEDVRLVAVKADEYRVEKQVSNGAWVQMGSLLLAERFGRTAFASSGAFAFVPYTKGVDGSANQQPFEGSLLLKWNGTSVSRIDVASASGRPLDENLVLDSVDPLDVARIQQRLRSLGYTGISGAPLAVDGILGPNTRKAIGQFNAAARQQASGAPSSSVDLSWINDNEAPVSGTLATERRLTSQEQAALSTVAGLGQNWLAAAKVQPAWSAPVPLLQGSADSLLPLGDVAQKLVQQVLGGLAATPELTVPELTAALQATRWQVPLSLVDAQGQATEQLFEFSLAPGATLSVTASATGLRVQGLVLRATSTTTVGMDLGAAAAQLGIGLDGVKTLSVTRTLDLGLDVELLADPSLSPLQAVVLHDLWVEGKLSTTVPDLDADFRAGAMEARILDGRIDTLQVSLRSGLAAAVRHQTLAQISAQPLASAFDLGLPQLRLLATLPMQVGTGITGTMSSTKVIDYTGVLTAGAIDWSGIRFGSLGFADFSGLDSADLLDGLAQLRDWLNALGSNTGEGGSLNIDWPTLKLPTLGEIDLPNLGDLLRLGNWITLPDLSGLSGVSNPGLPSFSLPSWQDLLSMIPGFQAGSLSFDAASRTLAYKVTLDQIIGQYLTTLKIGDSAAATPITLSTSSALADLNGGLGVADLALAGNALRVAVRDGSTPFDVSLQGVATLADVIARIELASRTNAADAATRRVQVLLSESADHLVVRDLTTRVGSGMLTVTASTLSRAGEAWVGLGLIGADTDNDGLLQGQQLVGAAGTLVQAVARLKGSFTIGVDLSPLGTAWGTLSRATTLATLNGNAGMPAPAGSGLADLRMTFSDGFTADVSLYGANDVGAVITKLEAASAGRLKMGVTLAELGATTASLDPTTLSLSGEKARLWLRDLKFGTGAAKFDVQALNGSLIGSALIGLGLVGSDDDGNDGAGDGVIVGGALHGDNVARHVFLRFDSGDKLQASVELAAPDIDARVDIGGLTVGIKDGTAVIRGSVDFVLRDPGERGTQASQSGDVRTYNLRANSLDGRITLAELGSTLSDTRDKVIYGDSDVTSRLVRLVGTPVLKGNANIDLPLVSQPAALLGTGAKISLDWSDLSNPSTLNVQATGLDMVQAVKNLAFSELIGKLRKIELSLRSLESTALFQQELPVIGDSLADTVGLADRFKVFVDELEKHPAQTVEQLQQAIADALAALSGASDGTQTATASNSYAGKLIRTSLAFSAQGSRTVPLNVDLGELGKLAGVSGLSGSLLAATGALALAWKGQLQLDLEIDASDALHPVVYLRDSSQAKLGLGLYSGDVDAAASLGPLGLFVRNGIVRLDSGQPILDGPSDTTVDYSRLATWTVDVVDDPLDHRHAIDGDFGLEDLATVGAGGLDVTLPIRFPDENTPLDPAKPNLSLRISDLDSPSTSTVITVPSFDAAKASISDFTSSLGDVWNAIDQGWIASLDKLAELLQKAVLNAPLPLVGSQLKDAVVVIGELRDALSPVLSGTVGAKTESVLVSRLTDALRPWLKDRNANGSVNDEISVTLRSSDRLELLLPLHLQQALLDADINFDLGLPGLGLKADGSVNVDLGFDWNLGIGLSKADGFYLVLDPATTEDMKLSLAATIPGFNARGELGFLQVSLTDDLSRPSKVQGTFSVDLKDPSGDGRLTLADIESAGSLSMIAAKFTGDADIHLKLEGSIEGSTAFPRLRTDLSVGWHFGGADTTAALFGDAPVVAFDNVQLNAGDFINGVLGPVIRNVKAVLDPIRPALDLLTQPIPGLSAIIPGANLLTLARIYAPQEGAALETFINKVMAVDQLVQQLASVASSGWIDIGGGSGLDVILNAGAADPRRGTNQQSVWTANTATKDQLSSRLAAVGAAGLVNSAGANAGFSFPVFDNPSLLVGLLFGRNVDLVRYTTPVLGTDLRFTLAQFPLPILPIILVRAEALLSIAAQFSVGFDTEGMRRYSVSGDAGDLLDGFYVDDLVNGVDVPEVRVSGGVGLFLALPRVRIQASVGIFSGGIDIDIYGGGGLRATLNFNLADPDHDGKVRADELATNLAAGPDYLFDISGGVEFFLQARALVRAWVEINLFLGKIRKTATLVDWSYDKSIPIISFSSSRPSNTPTLAKVDSNGTLLVHAGPNASLRRNGDTNGDGNEAFRLAAGSEAGSVVVSAFGFQQTYVGMRQIELRAGGGNDTITIGAGLAVERISVWGDDGDDILINDSSVPVVFRGGAGNDRLQGGSGADQLYGDAGNDQLSGGDGDDVLDGGVGNDQLAGGAGNDQLTGGPASGSDADDDTLSGDAGDDTLDGGIGNDRLAGGAGRDLLRGGSGDDSLDGGRDADVLFGGAGNDSLIGGDGNDQLDGEADDDFLQGGRGADQLQGGLGNDRLWGGLGDDVLLGGTGDDILYGGEDLTVTSLTGVTRWGADKLVGGQGNDTLYASAGAAPTVNGIGEAKQLFGDDEMDSATGSSDIIWGDVGDDLIVAGAGDDDIHAFDGHDRIDAGRGNDRVDAGAGDDLVVGGAGADDLEGGLGRDVIWGGQALAALDPRVLATGNVPGAEPVLALPEQILAASDIAAFAKAFIVPVAVGGGSMRDDGADAADGDDRVSGGGDGDWLFGGGGNDDLNGGGGEDYLDGGAGNDALYGDASPDVLRGGDGNDELHGGDGADLLYGDADRDQLYGDATDTNPDAQHLQQLWGGAGDDYLYAWSAASDATTWRGDVLRGGDGRDFLYGGMRSDQLYGDAGSDVLIGDAVSQNVLRSDAAQRTIGGNDQLFGGAGEDVLQGGGGNDVLRGGGDADRLEGQGGSDSLFGERGSDVLVVDLDAGYGAADLDSLDGHGDASSPDDGVDTLLVAGTEQSEQLTAAELAGPGGIRRLVVQRRAPTASASERGALQASATIEWRTGGLDIAPRLDQVQFSAGGGNDRVDLAGAGELAGAPLALDLTSMASQRLGWVVLMEGGAGNDTLIGSAMRDYLDGGAGSDTLMGMGGDDQIWGDADRLGTAADNDRLFGGGGNDDLYAGPGKADLFAWSIDPSDAQGQWRGVWTDAQGRPQLMSLTPTADELQAIESTGLNRMIGGGGDARLYGGTGLDALIGGSASNSYFNRDGNAITQVGDVVFNVDSANQLTPSSGAGFWAYGGSNKRDVIRVDYVTEPGLLTGRHLITRQTENAGNYTFDAQVRLDIQGWNADALYSARALANGQDAEAALAALQLGAQSRQGAIDELIRKLLPDAGPGQEFLSAIYIDAMAGDDDITVGSTVQTSVWVNAGDGDDKVRVEPGVALLADKADRQGSDGSRRNDELATAWILERAVGLFATPVRYTDLTLDNPRDVDWFVLGGDGRSAALQTLSLSDDDRMSLQLYAVTTDASGRPVLGALVAQASAVGAIATVNATFAVGTRYALKVSSDSVPTRYELRVVAPGVSPEPVSMLADRNGGSERHDLILGGKGNDVLIGGIGEDYIDGGEGNDVISGGPDRQAVDVLVGGAGDDIFQIWTDALAVNATTGQQVMPGAKGHDVFYGGDGNDRVLLLGGDLGPDGTPIEDAVTLRYSATQQRYEVATQVWDIANHRFITSGNGAPLQHYAFFQIRDTESLTVDLRAGNDRFSADPDHTLADGSEWGLSASDAPAGAALVGVTVSGGAGNDVLVGGEGNDTLTGGDGDDLLIGGLGDDHLEGGAGNDSLNGARSDELATDAFEWVSRGVLQGRNGSAALATDMRSLWDRSVSGNVRLQGNFDIGDGSDWYLVKLNDTVAALPTSAQVLAAVRAGLQSEHASIQVKMAEVTLDKDVVTAVREVTDPTDRHYVLLKVSNVPQPLSQTPLPAGAYFPSIIASLADGRHVTLAGADGRYSPVLIAADGSSSTSLNYVIQPTVNSGQYAAALTALEDGGFVLSWFDTSVSSYDMSLRLQRFGVDGSPVGAQVVVKSAEMVGSQRAYPSLQTVAAQKDGTLAIAWRDDVRGLWLTILNPQGQVVSSAVRDTPLSYERPDLAANGAGGFALVWTSYNETNYTATVMLQNYSAAGAAVGSRAILGTYSGSSDRAPRVEALQGGNVVVVWNDAAQMSVRVYTPDGAAVGSARRVSTTTGAALGSAESIKRLADGRLVVRGSSYDYSTSSYVDAGRLLDEAGVPILESFFIPSSGIGIEDWAPTADGGLVGVRFTGGGPGTLDRYALNYGYSLSLSSNLVANAPTPRTAQPWQGEAAQPLPPGSGATSEQLAWANPDGGLGLAGPGNWYSGGLRELKLSAPQVVGDFNGDGRADLLISDEYRSYLLLEPTAFGPAMNIAEVAQVVFDRSVWGTPAVRMGDLNNDGRSDLIFVNGKTVKVLFGAVAPERAPVTANWSYTFNQLDTLAGNLNVAAIAWDATGGSELAVVEASNNLNTATDIPALIGSISGSGTWTTKVTLDNDRTSSNVGVLSSVVLDFTGDGREDLVISDGFRLYGFAGGVATDIGATRYLDQATFSWSLAAFRGNATSVVDLFDLGDLEADGRADLGLAFRVRALAPSGPATAAAVVFGSSTSVASGNLPVGLTVVDPILRPEGTDPAATLYVTSQYTMTSGDFDGDGRRDLAVGRPFLSIWNNQYAQAPVSVSNAGQAWVLTNLPGAGNTINLASAVTTMKGSRPDALFGLLPANPTLDLDGDLRHDLLIGAAFEDLEVAGEIFTGGGVIRNRVADVPRSTVTLPTDAVLIANDDGRYLASTQVGAAIDKTGQTLNGSTRWYTFETRGGTAPEGAIVADLADRLVQDAGGWSLRNVPLQLQLFDAQGHLVGSSGRVLGMAGLPAGKYFVKVTAGTGWVSGTPFTLSLRLNPDVAGVATDRDALIGGEGADRLRGGGHIDRLLGGAGTDRFYGDAIEIRDALADDFVKTLNPLAAESVASTPPLARDAAVKFGSADVRDAVRRALALPVGALITRGAMATLTKLDLSGLGAISLVGLEAATNLEELRLNNLEPLLGSGTIPTRSLEPLAQLHYLRLLAARNAQVGTIPDVSGMTRLELLDLSGNMIQSLRGLSGATIVDDDPSLPGSYVETGIGWSSGRQRPAVGGDYRFISSNESAVATWRLPTLAAGTYRLEATLPMWEVGNNTPQLFDLTRNGQYVAGESLSPWAMPDGSDGRPWMPLGTFEVGSSLGDGDGFVVSTQSTLGGLILADAIRVVRTDVPLPASATALRTIDLSGNPLLRAEVDGAAPLLRYALSRNGPNGQLILPANAFSTTTQLSAPDFIDLSGVGQNVPSSVSLPFVTGGPLVVNGYIGNPNGITTVDHIEFEVISEGPVTIDVVGAGLTDGLSDPEVRLFYGPSARSSAGGEIPGPLVTSTSLRQLDDRSTTDANPKATISLLPGRYVLEVSAFSLTADEAKAGAQSYSSGAQGRYIATITGNVRSVSGTQGGALNTAQVAWTSPGVAAQFSGSQLVVQSNWTGQSGQLTGGEVAIRGMDAQGRTGTESIRTVFSVNGTVYGTVFDDVNGDGLRQATEGGLEGMWVGIDSDGDGSLSDEEHRVGAYTDYKGRYVISLVGYPAELTAAARVLVTDPSGQLYADTHRTLRDTYSGLSLWDTVGTRDLGVNRMGLPNRMDVVEDSRVTLPLPTVVQTASGPRSNLVYRWFVYDWAAVAPETETARMVGDDAPLSFTASEFVDTYRVVLAAFEPGQTNRTIGNALALASTLIVPQSKSTGDAVRTLSDQQMTEGQVLTRSLFDALGLEMPLDVRRGSFFARAILTPLDRPGAPAVDVFETTVGVLSMEGVPSGQYRVDAVLGDRYASSTRIERFTWTLTVLNATPVLSFATPAPVVEGSLVVLTPTATDPGGDTLSYAWTVQRQGQTGVLASGQTQEIRFVAPDNGNYDITVTASDSPSETAATQRSHTLVRTLTVTNAAPSGVSITASGNEQGRPIGLSAVYSDPGPMDTQRFTWRVLDPQNVQVLSVVDGTADLVSFVPTKIGNYSVTLTVKDKDGASTQATRVLPVLNLAPVLNTTLVDRTLAEGTPVEFTASATDVDPALTYTWTVTLGGVVQTIGTASTSNNLSTFTLTPPEQGSYVVQVKATDTAGASTTMSATLTVTNAAPSAVAVQQLNAQGQVVAGTGSISLSEGAALSVRAAATDVAADPLTYTWTLLNAGGTSLATGSGLTWVMPNMARLQAGSYTLRLSVSDGDGGATTVERGLVITNAVPTFATTFTDRTGLFIGTAAVAGSLEVNSPAGDADVVRAEIDWGDGGVSGVALVKQANGRLAGAYDHAYVTKPATGGFFQATVRVVDDEGSVLSSGFRVFVADGPRLVRSGGAVLSDLTEGVATSYTSYQLSLDAAPLADVVIDIVADEQVLIWDRVPTDAARQNLQRVVFTPANWATPRTVWLTSRDDAADEPTRLETTVRHVVSSTDDRVMYQVTHGSTWQPDVRVGTLDNDAPSLLITQVSSQTSEAAGKATFRVQLASQPTSDVIVDLLSSNTGEGVLSVNSLRFTSQTWNIAQTVTVTGVDDKGATSTNDAFQVRFARVSGAAGYQGLTPAPLSFTNLNTAPLPPTLKVTGLTATASGFVLTFSDAVDVSAINLYEARDPTERTGTSDLTVMRGTVAVRGSLVFDSTGKVATFVGTGGALAAGTYTVALKGNRTDTDGLLSRGFRSVDGRNLDGNADGTAGDDYNGSFVVGAFTGATLSVADFARGPGQAVNVPAVTNGALPLMLNTGSSTTSLSVSAIDIVLKLDPTLLSVTSVVRGAGLPTDANVNFSVINGGAELRIAIDRTLPFTLTGTALELVRLVANVPASARYGADQVLDLDIKINGGAIAARADDGVHLAAFLGDVTGDKVYGALDAQRLARVINNTDSGFAAYARISPLIPGDVTGSSQRPDGFVSAPDRTALLDVVLGTARVELPALPLPDSARPVVSVATVNATVGQTVSVPVSLASLPLSASGGRVQIAFDGSKLEFLRASRGDLALGFDAINVSTLGDGRTLLDLTVLLRSSHAASGVLALLDFRPRSGSAGSTLALDVIQLQVDGGAVPLGRTPTSGADPSDGAIVVAAGTGQALSAVGRVSSLTDVAGEMSLAVAAAAAASPSRTQVAVNWDQLDPATKPNAVLETGRRRQWLARSLAPTPVASGSLAKSNAWLTALGGDVGGAPWVDRPTPLAMQHDRIPLDGRS